MEEEVSNINDYKQLDAKSQKHKKAYLQMSSQNGITKQDANFRVPSEYISEKQGLLDQQKVKKLQKVHSNHNNLQKDEIVTKEIDEAEQQPEHNNFVKFIQIFNYQNLSKDGANTHLLNFICNFINNCNLSSLSSIWHTTNQNGKTSYVNDVLTLKLPHNPLFHIYKTFLDILIENEVTESEIDRLMSYAFKIRLRIENMHKSTMEEVQRKIGTTQSGHILGNKSEQFKDNQDEQTQLAIKNALKKMIAKDKQKIKRYMAKILEKLRNYTISNQTESPDPLNEHSNSVQEQIQYKQEINGSGPDLINQIQGTIGRNQNQIGPSGSGGLGQGNKKFYKMQFYTSNNFFPSKNGIPQNSQKQKHNIDKHQGSYNKSHLQNKQYLNTENFIKEESSEENQMITEDEAEHNMTNQQIQEGGGVMNRRRKLQKMGTNVNNTTVNNDPLQISPGQGIKIYQQSNISTHMEGMSRAKLHNMKAATSENNYNDLNERSITNRTPLLEHYQNHSLPRNAGPQASTSVPRPTIASGIKLLKESSTSPIDQSYQQQFLHSNNLKNFMWNKGAGTEQQEEGGEGGEHSNRGGSRIKKDYSIGHDNQVNVRPSTRNNQRRPVSRQINAIDNSGVSAQKLMVQQQMRNTHFGDGFGFTGKFKGDISLDSERKVSRKRGTVMQNNNNQQQYNNMGGIHQEDQSLRDSVQGPPPNQQQLIRGQTTTQKEQQQQKQYQVGKDLNRSITVQQPALHPQQNDQVSTQESSGTHFYQANSFLNKSIESNSSRSIMLGAQQHLQTMLEQQHQTTDQQHQYINNMKNSSQQNKQMINNSKKHANNAMGGTSYENNAFKNNNISRNNSQHQKLPVGLSNGGGQRETSQSPPLKPIDEIVVRKEGAKGVNPNQTQGNKFYINNNQSTSSNNSQQQALSQQQQQHNKIIRKKSRNNGGAGGQDNQGEMKSYNVTQEKFYQSKPSGNSNTSSYNQQQPIEKRPPQKMQTFYNTKTGGGQGGEVKMSLEFINHNSQMMVVQQNSSGGGGGKKKGMGGMKEKAQEMIREEQYDDEGEEGSEQSEGQHQQQQQKHYFNNENDKSRGGQFLEENYSLDSLQTPGANAIVFNYGDRPTNRLGCSRAFHQTKGDWKQGGGGVSEYSNSNAHSLPRNNMQSLGENGEQTSCKTTSSAASLTMIQKPQIGNTGCLNNNSSISPKPHKWGQQQHHTNTEKNIYQGGNNINISVNIQNINIGGSSSSNTQAAMQNASQKIQEIQKEVSFMYLGNPKKKVTTGIKLNPINRASGNEQSYVL